MGTSPGRRAPRTTTSKKTAAGWPGWPREVEVLSLARPSEAWNPTPPARSPATAHAVLHAQVLLNPRIRGIARAFPVPCSRIAMPPPPSGRKATAIQQFPYEVPARVRLGAQARPGLVSPPLG